MKNKYTTITRSECEARIAEKIKEIEAIVKEYDPKINYLDMTINKGHISFNNCYWDSTYRKLDYFQRREDMRTLIDVLNYARERGMAEKNIARLADETPSEMSDQEYVNIIMGIDCEME